MTCTSRRQENHRALQPFTSVGKHMLHLRQRHEIAAGQTRLKDRGAKQSPQPPLGGQQPSDHHDCSAPGEVGTWHMFKLAEHKPNAVAVVTA